MSGSSKTLVDRRRLLKILKISGRHLAELEAEGVIVPFRRGRGGRSSLYALEDVVPAYLRRVTSAPEAGEEREARRRRDLAQARFVELKISKEEGNLIRLEDVVLAGQAYTKAWAAKVRSLPRQMIQRGLIPKERETDADSMVRVLLTDISQWQTVADLMKAV